MKRKKIVSVSIMNDMTLNWIESRIDMLNREMDKRIVELKRLNEQFKKIKLPGKVKARVEVE